MLTNDLVSFEQPGPELQLSILLPVLFCCVITKKKILGKIDIIDFSILVAE